MEFVFPAFPLDHFNKFESILQLREMISKQLIQVGMTRRCKYKITFITKNVIYAKCTRCPAMMKADHTIFLDRYNNRHVHVGLPTNGNKLQRTIEMLQDIPAGVELISMKKYVTQTLGVSEFTFYKALREIEGNQRGVNFRTLLPFLQQKGNIVFEPFPVQKVVFFPEMLLCITQNMKKSYLTYGRFIGIDFTYNLIREVPYLAPQQSEAAQSNKKKKPKQWITGIISGLDSARRLLIYGVAFCYSETADNIEKILDNFFDVMGKQCQTILSDGGLGIEEAIRRLQSKNIFQGTHLLDSYHFMANLKVKYQYSEVLRRLYLAPDQQEYFNIFEQQVVLMDAESQRKLGKFNENSHKFCISKIPTTFVGLGCSTSMSQKINDLIKTTIPREASFSEVITKIIKLADKINVEQPPITYQSYPFQSVLLNQELKQIRGLLNKYVFQRLLRQLFKTGALQYEYCSSKCFQQDSKYYCECLYQEKTGLPCRHILKMLAVLKKPLLRQIDEYWLNSSKDDLKMKRSKMISLGHRIIKRGRPKNSRRNLRK